MSEIRLNPDRFLGNIQQADQEAPIPNATWYSAEEVGDGLFYRFPVGALAMMKYLTADMLLDGKHKTSFVLTEKMARDLG